MKFTLAEKEIIERWKEIIIGNLHTQFRNGMTENEFAESYTNAPKEIIKKAIQELITERKVEPRP